MPRLSLYSNIPPEAVISLVDVDNIYKIPLWLESQGVTSLLAKHLELETCETNLDDWTEIIRKQEANKTTVVVAMVGKYTNLTDSYKSVNEALVHGGIYAGAKVEIKYINAEELEKQGSQMLHDVDAILVPGGFGDRGILGKIKAAQHARENKIPYFGICLGMQVAVIELARNCLGLNDANSTEFSSNTSAPVVGLITEWASSCGRTEVRDEKSDMGGTMRLGAQESKLVKGTKVHDIYNELEIKERHRHRYEVNEAYLADLISQGMVVSGLSKVDDLVEIVEMKDHPWFIGCQFHPEFTSTPKNASPLFVSFIKAAMKYSKSRSKIK